MKILAQLLLISTAVFAITAHASAQVLNDGNRTGLPPFGSYQGSDFESVSLSNGNLHVELPILNLSQRGGNGGNFKYVYDTQGWNIPFIPVASGPNYPGYYVVNPNPDDKGWQLVDVANTGAFGYNYDVTTVKCTTIPPYNNYTLYFNYTIKDSRGTRHPVPLRKEGNGSAAVCLGQVTSAPALDGSGFIAQLGTNGHAVAKLIGPSGEQNSADANGNYWTTTLDTMGRQPYVFYNAPNITYTTPLNLTIQGPAYSTITMKDSSGTDRVYRIDYVARDIASNLCTTIPGNCVESGQFARLNIAKITLPSIDATTKFYQFTWDNGVAASGLGNLTRIDLPTGGYISYTYVGQTFRNGLGLHPPRTGRGVVTQRTVYDGTQSSTWSYSAGTVTAPSYAGIQNEEVHTFFNGAEISAKYYAGSSASGTLLRTVTTDYAAEISPVTGEDTANVRPIRVTTMLDNGLASKVETDYETFTYTYGSDDGYCGVCTATRLNPTERREYAYGSGAAGPLVRKTTYTYLHTNNQSYITRNIVKRVKLVSVYDGTGALKAQTQNDYDVYNYADMGAMQASNAVQHDGTNYGTSLIYRGNVTATKVWRNTDGAWLETRRQYDDAGNILRSRDPLNHFTTFDYTDNWANSVCAAAGQAKGYVKSITNALNQSTVQSYNSCTGTVAASTDPNSKTTTFTDDFRNRPDITTFPDGGQVDNDYDETNRVVTVKRKLTATASVYSKVNFDLLGRVTRSQLCEDGASACATSIKTDTTYDALGRVATISNPYRTANDPGPTNGITTSQYDALHRLAILIPPDGTVSANNVAIVYNGNCTIVTDQAGKKRKRCWDALRRLIQAFEPDSGDNFVYETDYQYDTLDNLTHVDQKGNDANSANWRTRTFVYNSLSQLTSATNPETGPAASSGAINYAYNDDGVLISKSDARGITVCFGDWNGTTCNGTTGYDAVHRLLKKTYSNNDPSVSYFYDQATYNGLTITNGVGRRTGMSDPAGAEAWTYDAMGRALVDRRTTNAITKNTSYTYNFDGSVASLTYPGGRVIVYTPDFAGRPIFVLDQGLNFNYAWGTCGPSGNGVCYSPSGAVSFMKNGTLFNSTFLFDKRLQPCWSWVNTTNTGAPATCGQTGATTAALLDFQYAFGLGAADNGNINRLINRRNPSRSITYQYDELNRIKSAVTDATSGTFCWGQSFVNGYDPWGNLKTITPDSSRPGCTTAALSKTINAYNKIIDSGYGYDNAGNMTAQPGVTATFNAENQMTSAAGVTYTYDGDGKRVKKSNGKLYWYGVGSDALSEGDLSGNITDAYIFFDGKRIARQTSSGNGVPFFYFSDHLGTTRVVAQNGASSACYDADYYPFGAEAAIAANTCPQNYKFTGKERDAESGLDDFGARYESSSLARFMSPDPLLNSGKPSDPQTWNRYAYAQNNPLNVLDPTGLYNTPDSCTEGDRQCEKELNKNRERLRKALEELTEKVDKMKDGVEKARLQAALKALGTAEDGNNVFVRFGSLPGEASGHTDPTYNQQSNTQAFNVTFDPSKIMGTDNWAMDAAHEGTHIADDTYLLKNPSATISDFSFEYRAYQTSVWAASALGETSVSFGNRQYVIWNSSWAAIDDHVLTRFIVERYGHQEPTNPDGTPAPHNPWPN